jgi:hypothetical protein
VNEEVRKRSSRAPILVGKKVQHTFNEGTHNGKVISTVPGFPDFYNIIYDGELDSEGNITDTIAIYTYRLLDDYRAKKLETSSFTSLLAASSISCFTLDVRAVMLKAFPLNEALNIALSFTYCFNILCLNLSCAMSALCFSVCFVIDLRIRCLEIERKRFDALKEKQEALRKKKGKYLQKRKEKQTSDIIYYGKVVLQWMKFLDLSQSKQKNAKHSLHK